MLGRRFVFGVDRDLGAGDRSVRVAGLRQMLVLLRYLGGVLFLQSLRAERRGGRLFVVTHFHIVGGFARGLERVGNHHRDDLAAVKNLGAELLDRGRGAVAELDRLELGRVVLGQDVEHAGHGARLIEVDALRSGPWRSRW